MKKCEFTLKIGEDSFPITTNFEDVDWQVLLDYVSYALDLNELSMVRSGAYANLSINYKEGQPLTFESQIPPGEQLFALMHRLRPFILQKESTYFDKVTNILTKEIDNGEFRELIKRLRSTFSARRFYDPIKLTVNDGFVITSEKALQTWLNGFEYHRAKDAREAMEQVFAVFPEDASRAIFVMLLIEKVKAIRALAPLVMVVTHQKSQFTITV